MYKYSSRFTSVFLQSVLVLIMTLTWTEVSLSELDDFEQLEKEINAVIPPSAPPIEDRDESTDLEDSDSISSTKRKDTDSIENEILSAQKKVRKNPKDTASRNRLAKLYLKKKDYQKVINFLRPQFSQLKRDGFLILAYAYHQKNDFLQEIRVLTQVTAEDEKDYIAATKMGNAYYKIKKYDEASKYLRQAIKHNRRYVKAYHILLELYKSQNNHYEQTVILFDMIKVFGYRSEFLNQICRLYTIEAFYKNAITYCRKGVEIDPRIAENHVYLGLSYIEAGKVKKGRKAIRFASNKFPKSELAQQEAGKLAVTFKNHQKAYKHFKLCHKANPKNKDCLTGFATSAFEQKKYDESLNAFKKLCKFEKKELQTLRLHTGKLRAIKSPWYLKFRNGLEACKYQ